MRPRGVVATRAVVVLALLVAACDDEPPAPAPRPAERLADWWLDQPPRATQVDLVVFAGEADCDAYRGVDVTEFEDEIRVTARVDAIGGADCRGERRTETVEVPLAEPVGDRALTGCVAPEGDLRHPELDDHDEVTDCRDRRPPTGAPAD